MRVVTRPVLPEDRRTYRYFEHMAGLTGVVANVYGPEEVTVRVDKESAKPVGLTVHKEAVLRLRAKVVKELSEDAKSRFNNGELDFDANYVLLVRGEDLEKL